MSDALAAAQPAVLQSPQIDGAILIERAPDGDAAYWRIAEETGLADQATLIARQKSTCL
jgi:hypothetical protein